MNKNLLQTTLSLAICSSLFAGPAEDIITKHAKATAAELEAYLKENPNAEDKDKAHQALLTSYNLTGEDEKSMVIFKDRFNALGSGAGLDARILYSSTYSLFNVLLKHKKTDEALKITEAAITKAAGHEQETQLVNAFKLMQGQLNKPKVGDTMEVKFTSLQGEAIDLAAMKGKVVLIDFWATWCGPCIAELPHLQKAYDEYHDKGFEIIGISHDRPNDKQKLETFIKSKNMSWPQSFNNTGANPISLKYGINSIPSTFLIGKDGKVVATNLRGTALEKALAEHLGK